MCFGYSYWIKSSSICLPKHFFYFRKSWFLVIRLNCIIVASFPSITFTLLNYLVCFVIFIRISVVWIVFDSVRYPSFQGFFHFQYWWFIGNSSNSNTTIIRNYWPIFYNILRYFTKLKFLCTFISIMHARTEKNSILYY